jgi:hypothetical protein
MNGPSGPIREIGTAMLWTAAAGNVLVYTVKVFKASYTRPPLGTWQKGAGETPTKGSEKGPEEKGSKGGGESLGETLVNPLGPNPLVDPLAPFKATKKLLEGLFG